MFRSLHRYFLSCPWRIAILLAAALAIRSGEPQELLAAESQSSAESSQAAKTACKVLADKRLVDPLRTISAEYNRRTGSKIDMRRA